MLPPLDRLSGGLLVASPALRDPNFDHTVVLMCLHNDQGAMGLVINRPAPINTNQLLQQIGIESAQYADRAVMIGGPVSIESGVLLYQPDPLERPADDEVVVADDLRLCPSQERLRRIAAGGRPRAFQIFLGHAGWGPGQLEREISQGAWIPARLELALIFETPVEHRWEGALHAEGVSPAGLGAFRPQS